MGISGNPIAAIIHLTDKNLHINVSGFGFLESIFEPTLNAIGDDFGKWEALTGTGALHLLLGIGFVVFTYNPPVQSSGFSVFPSCVQMVGGAGDLCEMLKLGCAGQRFSHKLN